jgi:hypothetical protein
VTKTEKLKRARKVRRELSLFVDLQEPSMREHVRREWNRDPDYSALNHLLLARHELQLLIQDLSPSS